MYSHIKNLHRSQFLE